MQTTREKKLETHQPLPDRFSFFSSTRQAAASSTWDGLFPGGNIDHIFQEKHKSRPGPSQPVWWIDIRDPTEQDVDAVSQVLSIHPLTAEDITIREPREKVDVYKNYYLISFQTLVSSKAKNKRPVVPISAAIYILVFQHGVVTFSPSGCGHVARAQERIRRMHDPTVLSSDWVCYAMIDEIIDSFEPYVWDAERESEAIEDQVFTSRSDDAQALIPQVDALRKKITHITRCLNGKVDVLNGFVKRCQSPDKHPVFPDGDLLLYLGDVQDHLVTTLSTLGHIDEIIGRSQANYLAQMSATNLRLSLTINSGLSKVTLLATIFVPCHLVTGLWGMNVSVPGEGDKGLGWFFGIVGGFAAFMLICIAMATKYKLL